MREKSLKGSHKREEPEGLTHHTHGHRPWKRGAHAREPERLIYQMYGQRPYL